MRAAVVDRLPFCSSARCARSSSPSFTFVSRMNTTSSRLAEHLYPNTPAHPQLVFRICRQGTIEADGSLRPPGAGDPSARKFRWSEQEVVRHIKGGSYERCTCFLCRPQWFCQLIFEQGRKSSTLHFLHLLSAGRAVLLGSTNSFNA